MLTIETRTPRNKQKGIRRRYIRIYDVNTKKQLYTTQIGNEAQCVALSDDWCFALVGESNSRVFLWDLTQGREVHAFTGHQKPASVVKFLNDGRTAASGSKSGWIIRWKLPFEVVYE